jgi:hypothetical protein
MKNYHFEAHAGHGAEVRPGGEDIYCFMTSPIPEGVKSIDDEFYKAMIHQTLEVAKEVVRKTGNDIILSLEIKVR